MQQMKMEHFSTTTNLLYATILCIFARLKIVR